MVINPFPFMILRGREKRIEIHATSIVVATTLRTDVFTEQRWCRFASWVWNRFKHRLLDIRRWKDRDVEDQPPHGILMAPTPHMTSVPSQIIAAGYSRSIKPSNPS